MDAFDLDSVVHFLHYIPSSFCFPREGKWFWSQAWLVTLLIELFCCLDLTHPISGIQCYDFKRMVAPERSDTEAPCSLQCPLPSRLPLHVWLPICLLAGWCRLVRWSGVWTEDGKEALPKQSRINTSARKSIFFLTRLIPQRHAAASHAGRENPASPGEVLMWMSLGPWRCWN